MNIKNMLMRLIGLGLLIPSLSFASIGINSVVTVYCSSGGFDNLTITGYNALSILNATTFKGTVDTKEVIFSLNTCSMVEV